MSWFDRVDAAVHAALIAARDAPPSASHDPTVALLVRCATLVESLPMTGPDPLVASLRGVMATLIVTDEHLDDTLAERIGDALNACLDRPGRASSLESTAPAVDRAARQLLVSHDSPSLKRAARSTWSRSMAPAGSSNVDQVAIPETRPEPDVAADDDDGELDPFAPPPLPAPTPQGGFADAQNDARPALEIPPVRLGEGGEPITLDAHYASVVHLCVDTLGMLARHRVEAPLEEVPDVERRALTRCDAIAAIGRNCVGDVLDWWSAASESNDAWKAWGALFPLALLDGGDALLAVEHVIRQLAADDVAAGMAAAEALVLAPHPDMHTLADDLVECPHPVGRAVAIELLARSARLADEDLERHLLDTNVAVAAAGLRACARRPLVPSLVPVVGKLMGSPDSIVAWEACRSLSLWGRADAYFEWKRGGRLAKTLGLRGAELLVLFGDESDLELLERALSVAPPTAQSLSIVARFGHPASWAYLLHHLGEPDLAEDAARALTTIFGPRVPDDSSLDVAAWSDAIEAAQLDPTRRYRRGEPWRPRVVAAECTGGTLSRLEVEARIDELSVRTGAPGMIDLRHWFPELRTTLNGFLAKLPSIDASWREGGWDCKTS